MDPRPRVAEPRPLSWRADDLKTPGSTFAATRCMKWSYWIVP